MRSTREILLKKENIIVNQIKLDPKPEEKHVFAKPSGVPKKKKKSAKISVKKIPEKGSQVNKTSEKLNCPELLQYLQGKCNLFVTLFYYKYLFLNLWVESKARMNKNIYFQIS